MGNRIEKTIDIKNGKIMCRESEGYTISTSFRYFVLDENGKPMKNFDFNMWDDFSFAANKRNLHLEENLKKIEFVIEKENPMYIPIKNFLNGEESFILDDDDTSEINKKTMEILDTQENIKIIFKKNEAEKEDKYEAIFNKFRVFIKNILYDGRSKLDQNSGDKTKERLINLFKDLKVEICSKEALEDILTNWSYGINRLYGNDKEIVFKIIPELEYTVGFDQKHPHHSYDVWEHTVKAVEKSKNDLDIRLALLLHDIGKPHSYQEENGIRHFKGHPQKSEEMTQEILTRLGYDEKKIEDICYLVEHHDDIIDVNQVNSNNRELIEKLLHIQYCDAYAHAPEHIEKRIKKLDGIKLQMEEKILEDILLSKNNNEKINLDENKEIIFRIIPELKATDGFEQKNPYHIYDVWGHIVKAVEKSENNLEIRLALLLHDIGKPHSCQEENGIRHFKGHPQKSEEMAEQILTRLGYEEKQIEDICFLIANHATTIDVENVNKDNLEITKKLLHVQYCDAYAYNPEYIRPALDKLDVIYRKLESIEKEEKGER